MKEIAIPMNKTEFVKYMECMRARVDEYREQGLGYVSITCQLTKDVLGDETVWVYTRDQLREIFALAKK